jgi:hypothetical protein
MATYRWHLSTVSASLLHERVKRVLAIRDAVGKTEAKTPGPLFPPDQ